MVCAENKASSVGSGDSEPEIRPPEESKCSVSTTASQAWPRDHLALCCTFSQGPALSLPVRPPSCRGDPLSLLPPSHPLPTPGLAVERSVGPLTPTFIRQPPDIVQHPSTPPFALTPSVHLTPIRPPTLSPIHPAVQHAPPFPTSLCSSVHSSIQYASAPCNTGHEQGTRGPSSPFTPFIIGRWGGDTPEDHACQRKRRSGPWGWCHEPAQT